MLSFQKFFWFNGQKYYICTDSCMSYVEYCMHTSKAHFCTLPQNVTPHNIQFDWTIISILQTPATTQTTYPIHQTTAHYIPSIIQHHQITNLIHTTKNKSDLIEITTSKTTKIKQTQWFQSDRIKQSTPFVTHTLTLIKQYQQIQSRYNSYKYLTTNPIYSNQNDRLSSQNPSRTNIYIILFLAWLLHNDKTQQK
jgi:hypothetical protein